ncbi:sodium:proton antiporter, partial [Escherichia coli]|nr:sodium:proton antiporter [Escherichia coli]
EDLSWLPLLLALLPLAAFAIAVQRGVRAWWILIPLGVAVWALVHASGIHATVAGVLLGFMVPVIATGRAHVRVGTTERGEAIHEGLAAHFADRWSIPSSILAIPVFAFFAAGVPVGGLAGLGESLLSPVALGI